MKPMDDEPFEDFNAACVTDCTGLIPSAPQSEFEYESYRDIMTFYPADFKSEEIFQGNIFVN